MTTSFLHGVETIEVSDGIRPVVINAQAVILIVGTAPLADPDTFPYDEPVLLLSSPRKAALLGTAGTLLKAVKQAYVEGGTCIVVIRVPATFDFIIKNAQVFINGVGKAGTSDEFMLPGMNKIKETKMSGGLIGQRDVFMGWKPFEMEVTLNAFDPEVTKLVGITDGNEFPMSARGYMVGDRGKQHTAVWTGSGEMSELKYEKWQAGKWTACKFKYSCSAMGYTVDGSEVYDIDIPNGINSWGGTDLAAYMRSAIGLAV